MSDNSLCRPDNIHWCIECCRKGCPLLGKLNDGTIGCLGHNGRRTPDNLTQISLCQKFDCLEGKSQKEKEEIRQLIAKLPPGEFKMSQVLS